MEKDIVSKIKDIFRKGEQLSENELRSGMILIRKMLERMSDSERSGYLILNLFCNWSAHTEITKSKTGFRILAKVNNALVDIKHSSDPTEMGLKMSEAIGFTELRRELKYFLNQKGVEDKIVENDRIWGLTFLSNLIEILRDVPLSFPQTLESTEQKIYDLIAKNPIKPGAGVVSICLANTDFEMLGIKSSGERLCLYIRMVDTTTVVIPLTIDVRVK